MDAECLRLVKSAAPIFIYGFPEILAHISVRYPLEKQKWLVWHYTNKLFSFKVLAKKSRIHSLYLERKKTTNKKLPFEKIIQLFSYAAGKVRKETYCRYSTKGKKTIYQAHPKGALPRDVLKVPFGRKVILKDAPLL